jgi:hypothetical protein
MCVQKRCLWRLLHTTSPSPLIRHKGSHLEFPLVHFISCAQSFFYQNWGNKHDAPARGTILPPHIKYACSSRKCSQRISRHIISADASAEEQKTTENPWKPCQGFRTPNSPSSPSWLRTNLVCIDKRPFHRLYPNLLIYPKLTMNDQPTSSPASYSTPPWTQMIFRARMWTAVYVVGSLIAPNLTTRILSAMDWPSLVYL